MQQIVKTTIDRIGRVKLDEKIKLDREHKALVMKHLSIALGSIFFLAFVAFAPPAFGQKLISSAPNGSLPIAKTNARIEKVLGQYSVGRASAAIDLQKVTYSSTDEDGNRAILTGLMAWPQGGAPKGLVVFCHGTIQDREASPSKWTGKENDSEAEPATLAFASGGYAAVIPDYLGLGDHKATHPYPRNIINSQSGIDIIEPAPRTRQEKRL